ncbi:MAG: hypothetical protein GY904_04350 [Planctomycetaceae bacterium]|nr:hypothetical protein [Planctomycetaceae bacterium]
MRIVLITILVFGFAGAIYLNHKRSRLRAAMTQLQKQVGAWEVGDKSKVVIAHIPVAEDAVPPGVDNAYVWQYRLHLPANYATCYDSTSGLVKADRPGGQSRGSSSSGPLKEPEQSLVTMALIETDGQWKYCTHLGGSSSVSNMPADFSIESLDDFVVEPVVNENEIRVFDADEAVCLFRLREKVQATDETGKTKNELYRGCAFYLFSQERKADFNAWARGQRKSMEATQP